MQQTTGAFQTPDKLNIFTIQWLPDDTPKAVVIIVHGLGEHIGRYQHVAEALVSAGYAVYGLDHRGHGRSNGKRVQVTSNTHFIDDLKQYFDTIRQEHDKDKIFILGHSMGSVISLQFALKYQNSLAGLIVTGTATDVGSTVGPMLQSAANVLHRILPHMPIGAPLPIAHLTNDKAIQEATDNDALNHKGWTPISIAKYIIDTGAMIQDNVQQLVLPILIMHGEDDRITPISGSRIVHERVGSADKTLKTWDNMQHEIMNEIDRDQVIGDIIDWLENH
ncbi:MAG: lysophospholipase [Anaerolineae bacterium]|nr:lysophospholipase [Anaerolineae bacterium]MDQ7036743.1 lysophospholipase [Anaerolineae bacterium]